jgi:hypothetical protein
MTAKPSPNPWTRLVAAARLLRDQPSDAAPYGFSTRIAALAIASRRVPATLVERFAWKAVGLAALLAITSVAINYSFLNRPSADDQPLAAEDPLSVLLDV